MNSNAMATILLCSRLNYTEGDAKPFTSLQWSKLVIKIINSSIKEPKGLFDVTEGQMEEALKIDSNVSSRIRKLLSKGGSIAFVLEDLERKGIGIVTRSDETYPKLLKKRLKEYAPSLLYYSGNLDIANYEGIAVVGSRNINQEGEDVCRKLVDKSVLEKYTLISGGAKGIDSISEKTAINCGGKVVSIIADSLTRRIKKAETREQIINENLLLMSSHLPDVGFSAGNAMNRNKYIYALSQATFVIASDYQKGGTWTGAIENMKKEWTPIFVYDSEKYDGNKPLISKGAKGFVDVKSVRDLIRKDDDVVKQISLFDKGE